MAELKRNFLQGKMELDLDDRLVPAGVYRIAKNVAISRSDTSDVGALENLRGNRQIPGGGLTLTDNYEVLGTVADNLNDRVYWFFVGPSTEGIYEFDFSTQTVSRILEFSVSKRVFRFNTSHYITGANVIQGLLYWTDGLNPPRKINIERFRGTSLDPTQDAQGNSLVDLTNSELAAAEVNSTPPFVGDLISVGKRPPLFPPIISRATVTENGAIVNTPDATSGDNLYDNFVNFAYRYRYRDGEVSTLSPFSEVAFFPRELDATSRPTETEPGGVSFASFVNKYSAIDIQYDPGDIEVTEVELVVKYANNANLYSLTTINKEQSNISSSTPYTRNYQTFQYSNNKVYRVLPETELAHIYDNVPLTAKTQEIAGNRLVYGNYTENYDLRLRNEQGPRIIPNYTISVDSGDLDVRSVLPHKTVKSDRDYEVGIVYLDREGRQSAVLLSELSSTHVSFENHTKMNRLMVTINHAAPYWATHYRFFIKQSQGIFYNILPSRMLRGNDGKVYLELDEGESATNPDNAEVVDINKARVGDRLVYKGAGMPETTRREFIVDEVNPEISKVTGATSVTASTKPWLILKPVNSNDLAAIPTGARFDGIWETVPVLDSALNIYAEWGETFRCLNGAHTASREEIVRVTDVKQTLFSAEDGEVMNGTREEGDARDSITVTLNYFNCFGYPNGIEEINIQGDFNQVSLPQGIRFSTVNEEYRRRNQIANLIFSGIFNDDINLNRFNQFDIGLDIEHEIDIANGSIQHLHFRDTNLIVFQEDKVINIPINKNLIQTAGGTEQLTTSSDFFGTERAYTGEYGISQNPESFATYGNRMYFTDKNRGVMLRLSNNGITEISKNGVESYFRENISKAGLVQGMYDDFHDQYICALRNRPANPIPTLGNQSVDVVLSTDGCPDPRAECNRPAAFINFKRYYSIQASPRTGLQIDDTVFVDSERTIPFNGNYWWFRLRGANGDTSKAYQISPYGDITGAVEDCMLLPRRDVKTIFNISTARFTSEIDACASGVVDSNAYFTYATSGTYDEPRVGDLIYEGELEIVPSQRTGWYLITEGSDKYAIKIQNGEVILKRNCAEIERDRRSIVSSNLVELADGLEEARISIDLCQQPYAERRLYFRSPNPLPEVGDIVWDNNFNDTVVPTSSNANNNSYYTSADGYYIRVEVVAQDDPIEEERGLTRVVAIGQCAETLCFASPNDLFTQDDTNPYMFTFNGIDTTYTLSTLGRQTTQLDALQGIPNVEITYTVQGINKYGPFVINTATQGFHDFNTPIPANVDAWRLNPTDTFTLPTPPFVSNPTFASEGTVNVTINKVCYRGAILDTPFLTVYSVPLGADVVSTCGLSAANALYYNPNVSPIQYFENQALTTAFNSAAGQYGITDGAANSAVTRVETISSNGTVSDSSTVYCVAPYEITLGYTPGSADDNLQAACNNDNDTTVWADRPRADFSDAEANPITVLYRPNSLTHAANGNYTDGIVIRTWTAPTLGTRTDNPGCSAVDPRLGVTISGASSFTGTEGTNGDVTLTATSPEAGVTWDWDVTNATIVTGTTSSTSITIRRTTNGTASITLTGSKAGFRDGTDDHSVTYTFTAPLPELSLSGPNTAQNGDTVVLRATVGNPPSGLALSSFSFSGSTAASGATATLTPGVANTAQISFTEPLGTGATEYSVTVTGVSGSATHTITWGDAPPDPVVTISGATTATTGGSGITLTAVAENFTTTPTFAWTGGDAQGESGTTVAGTNRWTNTLVVNEPQDSRVATNGAGGPDVTFDVEYGVTASRTGESDSDTHTVTWTSEGEPSVPQTGLSFTLSKSPTTATVDGGTNIVVTASAVTRTDTGATIPNNQLVWSWNDGGADTVSGGTSSSTSITITDISNSGNVTATVSAASQPSDINFLPDTESIAFSFGAQPFTFETLNVLSSTTSGQDACEQESTTAFRASTSTLSSSTVLYTSTATSTSDTYATDVYVAANNNYYFWDASEASMSAATACATTSYFSRNLGYHASSSDSACSARATEYFTNDGGTTVSTITEIRVGSASTAARAAAGYYSIGFNWLHWDGSSVTQTGRCSGVYIGSRRITGLVATESAISSGSSTFDNISIEVVGVTATFMASASITTLNSGADETEYTITWNIGGTETTASDTLDSTATVSNTAIPSFSPVSVSLSEGTYTIGGSSSVIGTRGLLMRSSLRVSY